MLTTAFAFAQDKPAPKPADWPELKTFHSVMAQTFHPSEEGDLKPIKERAGEMVTKAEALQKSTPPAEFKSDKIKAAVDNLVVGSKELKKLVDGKADDAVITKNLAGLHDTFHEIVGLCQKGDDHDDHGHDSHDGHKH